MRRSLFCLLLITTLAPPIRLLAQGPAQETRSGEWGTVDLPRQQASDWQKKLYGPRLPLHEGFLALGATLGSGELDGFYSGRAGFYGAGAGAYFSLLSSLLANWFGTFDRLSDLRVADYLRVEMHMGQLSIDREEGPDWSSPEKHSSFVTIWRTGLGIQFNYLVSPDLEIGGLYSHLSDNQSIWNENHNGFSGTLYGSRLRMGSYIAELQLLGEPFPKSHYRTLRLRRLLPSGSFYGLDLERESRHPDGDGSLWPKGEAARAATSVRLLIGISR